MATLPRLHHPPWWSKHPPHRERRRRTPTDAKTSNPSFMEDPPKPTYAMAKKFLSVLILPKKEYYNHATINDAFTPTPPTTFQGKPAVVFKHADKEKFLKKMRHVLIGKFSHGRPSIADIKEFFVRLNLKGLPLHLFDEEALLSVANGIGKPLSIDMHNVKRIKLGTANVCVEVDASKPLLNEICVGFGDEEGEVVDEKQMEGFWQNIVYETVPDYCVECSHLGHNVSTCKRRKGKEIDSAEPLAIRKPVLLTHDRPHNRKSWQPKTKPNVVAPSSSKGVEPKPQVTSLTQEKLDKDVRNCVTQVMAVDNVTPVLTIENVEVEPQSKPAAYIARKLTTLLQAKRSIGQVVMANKFAPLDTEESLSEVLLNHKMPSAPNSPTKKDNVESHPPLLVLEQPIKLLTNAHHLEEQEDTTEPPPADLCPMEKVSTTLLDE
ncbi:hypothetical protein Leryth_025319 [Lithospermum erythrorhizon]|nr:hypothetical protein Leryth_025319 [Lithospermum erythrorhizon]